MAAVRMSGVSSAGSRSKPSAELSARVFRPEIVANVISYAASDKRELCRLLKVSKVFYHEATRLLYRSVTVPVYDLIPGDSPRTAQFFIDCGQKSNLLAYIRRLEVEYHPKILCPSSGSSIGPAGLLTWTLPNLKDLHISFWDCSSDDCPLIRGLHPTGDLAFALKMAYPTSYVVNELQASITRLSSSATSVTIDADRNCPAVFHDFLTIPFGASVTQLTFIFCHQVGGEIADHYRDAFTSVCTRLITSLEAHQMVNIASITFTISHYVFVCCAQCQESLVGTFADEVARFKGIWEYQSRILAPSVRSRVSINSIQHIHPEDLSRIPESHSEIMFYDTTSDDGSAASDEDDEDDEEAGDEDEDDDDDDEDEDEDEEEDNKEDRDDQQEGPHEDDEGYSSHDEEEAYDLDEEHHDEDEDEEYDHDEADCHDQEEDDNGDEDDYDEDNDNDERDYSDQSDIDD